MTMATDARKEVSSEWPTTSKRRCREGAGQEGDPILHGVCSLKELPN